MRKHKTHTDMYAQTRLIRGPQCPVAIHVSVRAVRELHAVSRKTGRDFRVGKRR